MMRWRGECFGASKLLEESRGHFAFGNFQSRPCKKSENNDIISLVDERESNVWARLSMWPSML